MFSLKTKLKIGDTVMVIAGKEKGKSGKILRFDKKRSRVVVEGLNMIKRHQKGNEQVASRIIEKENGIHISNVMATVKSDNKRSRLRYKIEEVSGKKQKVRVLAKTGDTFN